MAASRIILTWGNVGISVFFFLLFLDQFNVCLHDRLVVRIVLFCLGSEAIPTNFVGDSFAFFLAAAAARGYGSSPSRRIRYDLPDVRPPPHRCASQLLTRASREGPPLLGRSTCPPPCLVYGNPTSTKLLPFRQEPFTSIPLPYKLLMLVPQLVPQRVELSIMRAMHNMRQLMQHRIDDIFHGQELPLVVGIP